MEFFDGQDNATRQVQSRQVRDSLEQMSTVVVSQALADHIGGVERELRRMFGSDYSFSINGRGETVAASNYRQGRIVPKVSA